MKNYKITISYDGTKYNGWQRQGNTQNTIQEKFENVLSVMTEAREIADQLEEVTDKTYWPYPSYGDLLFSV